MILAIGTALKPQFRATCPIPTRSVRELKVEIEKPGNLMHRNNWNGRFDSAKVSNGRRKKNSRQENEVLSFNKAYKNKLGISKPKFNDLQVLKKFCKVENQEYFASIPMCAKAADVMEPIHDEIDDE